MRVFRWGPSAPVQAVRVASCACAVAVAFSLTGHAGQLRSVGDGVYSAGQAARGQQIYQAQCADCHGKAMEGASGPPLAGAAFLSNWSARPVANLVDKVQKTMPFNQPASLSRQQSTDLTAYILQGGKFAAGQAELTDATLTQIAFPTANAAAPAAATAAGASSLPPPEGNLAELMRAIAFPNSNIIFNLQLKDPGAPAEKGDGLLAI